MLLGEAKRELQELRASLRKVQKEREEEQLQNQARIQHRINSTAHDSLIYHKKQYRDAKPCALALLFNCNRTQQNVFFPQAQLHILESDC